MYRLRVIDGFASRASRETTDRRLRRPAFSIGSLARVRTPVSQDELLRQLHGRLIDGPCDSWQINVYSIVNGDAHRWIQLGLEGGTYNRTALLRLVYLADHDDAIAVLADWVNQSGAPHSGVLTVTASD